MKYAISIYLWIVLVLFFLSFLIFALIISYILPEEKYNPLLQKLLRLFLKILFCPVEVEGIEQINSEKTYLYMSNHVSLFDLPLLGGYLPGFVRGIEAQRQHKWPLYGRVMGRLGNIPIQRDSVQSSVSTIRKTIKGVSSGKSIAIMPEGHRTLDGNLREFKKLPFFLAKQAQKEVVPVGLSGLFSMKPKDSWLINPTRLKIKFGEPITVDVIKSLSTIELKEMVRSKILELIERP